MLKFLLEEVGIDVNTAGAGNYRIIHNVFKSHNLEMLIMCLRHGVNMNVNNNTNSTLIEHLFSTYSYNYNLTKEMFFYSLILACDINQELQHIIKKINNRSDLKNCLTAFKEIKAMPHLGKLVGTNIKKENAKVIRKYINNEANRGALIAEFKTISEKYGSDEQLAFIPRYLLNAVKHVNLAFLRSYIDKNTMVSCLHESKNDISIIKKKGSETEVISKMLPICASKKIVSYLNNDTYKNVLLALSKRIDEFLIELEETVHRPKSALTDAQPEVASSQSQNIA